jgi:N-acetylneuraminate lyase
MIAVKGRVPCIFHVARTSNREMLELARYAEEMGAAAISAIPPIFFKYTEDDIVAYYKRLAESVSIPVVIYNNPNTGVTFTQKLLKKLFSIPNITAIKWTNYDFAAVMQLKSEFPWVNVINGPDEMLLLGLNAGCDAGIGTTYNFQLPTMKGIYQAFQGGDLAEAQRLQTLACNVIGAIRPRNIILATRTIVSAQGVDVGTPLFPQLPYSTDEKENLLADVKNAGLKIN